MEILIDQKVIIVDRADRCSLSCEFMKYLGFCFLSETPNELNTSFDGERRIIHRSEECMKKELEMIHKQNRNMLIKG